MYFNPTNTDIKKKTYLPIPIPHLYCTVPQKCHHLVEGPHAPGDEGDGEVVSDLSRARRQRGQLQLKRQAGPVLLRQLHLQRTRGGARAQDGECLARRFDYSEEVCL